MGGIVLLLLLGIFVFAIVVYAINYFSPSASSGSRVTHNKSHPGITENGRDVICPKCKSPYCQYDYQTVQHSAAKTTYRVRPLHPFRPVKSTTREIPTFKTTVKQYRCTNCGWIFR